MFYFVLHWPITEFGLSSALSIDAAPLAPKRLRAGSAAEGRAESVVRTMGLREEKPSRFISDIEVYENHRWQGSRFVVNIQYFRTTLSLIKLRPQE